MYQGEAQQYHKNYPQYDMTNVVWYAFIGEMMSRCILRSYADGDNGYRTEIKEGKASERQKVAARAAWLRWMLRQACLNGGRLCPCGIEKGTIRTRLHLSCSHAWCAVSGTQTRSCVLSHLLSHGLLAVKHLSRNTSCICVKHSLAVLRIEKSFVFPF